MAAERVRGPQPTTTKGEHMDTIKRLEALLSKDALTDAELAERNALLDLVGLDQFEAREVLALPCPFAALA